MPSVITLTQRSVADPVGEAHRVADVLADRGAQLLGHPLGDRAGGDAAGLGVADQAVDAPPELEAQLGELGALARAGLAGHDDDLVLTDGRQQVVAAVGDRQRLRVAQAALGHDGIAPGAPQLDGGLAGAGRAGRRASRHGSGQAARDAGPEQPGSAPRCVLGIWFSVRILVAGATRIRTQTTRAAMRSAAAATREPKRRPGWRLRRSTGPLMLTAAMHVAVATEDRRADRRHAGLALLDALDPAVGADGAGQHPSGRADGQREQRALGDDPAQAVRRLQRHHAAPAVVLADEQLDALTGLVTQRGQRRAGELGQREPVGGGLAQSDQGATRARTDRRGPVARGRAARARRPGGGPWPGADLSPTAGRRVRPDRPRSSARRTATALSSTPTFDTVSTGQELYLTM